MKVRLDELIQAIAVALDTVEAKLLGASFNHGKRIAVLCSLMSRELGLDIEEIKAITTSALFHDNALTEYILSEQETGEIQEFNMKRHCVFGQRNINALPFGSSAKDLILYHHEQADGNGPFGKKADEIPVGAQLIAIADMVDVTYHLNRVSSADLEAIRSEVASQSGKIYTKTATDAMLTVLDKSTLDLLSDRNIEETAAILIPPWEVKLTDNTLIRLAKLAARIIDYASAFTRRHSVEIADKIWHMGNYYGFSSTKRTKAYLAAALHDLGKLATPTEILEKPGKLTDSEFGIIKAHAHVTYDLLSGITGFEEICDWASNHHEKLDGSGYAFGKKADELDFVSRLIACADIYQAVSEARPYHQARSHDETIEILFDMVDKGQVDREIVNDFNIVFGDHARIDALPLREKLLVS